MSANARILVVDDDPIMLDLAATRLKAAGYEVNVASNGREGLTALAKADIDLVISDLDMPEMNGYDLTREIRKQPRTRMVPVIVITGSEHANAVEAAFAAGATNFLAKPINWPLFTHAVKFVLRASRDAKALKQARDQAEAGARFKDSLMSVMSHELRTPLNAIIGFGQLLEEQFEREADHVHREYAEYIVDGGKRLLNSVSDMLLASDARSGPISINPVDCTLSDLIELALNTVSKLAEMSEAKIKTVLHEPELEICCDRLLLSRAIAKLIDNAIKFSERGVQIVVATTRTPKGDIAIMVRDDGPGIAQDKLRLVAQPFAQSDMSLRRSKEGLGLGLPLVQAIAAAHGARFKLESKPGRGSTALLITPVDCMAAKKQPIKASGEAA